MSAFDDFRVDRSMELLQESENVEKVTDFCVQYLLTHAPEYIKQGEPDFDELVQILRNEYECEVISSGELDDGC